MDEKNAKHDEVSPRVKNNPITIYLNILDDHITGAVKRKNCQYEKF